MKIWQLQEAKARFSELIRLCKIEGPQIVTIRGKEEAILLSKKEYESLIKKKPNLVDFISNSPLKGIELDLTRDNSSPRKIDL
jgi:prevent-host-death family protein